MRRRTLRGQFCNWEVVVKRVDLFLLSWSKLVVCPYDIPRFVLTEKGKRREVAVGRERERKQKRTESEGKGRDLSYPTVVPSVHSSIGVRFIISGGGPLRGSSPHQT